MEKEEKKVVFNNAEERGKNKRKRLSRKFKDVRFSPSTMRQETLQFVVLFLSQNLVIDGF